MNRVDYAEKIFEESPELFPLERRQSILNGVVKIGMSPFEAKLAGGAFTFGVIADPECWGSVADPLKVMWQQSLKPDNSEIWMMFQNKTQFASELSFYFRVYFLKGKAVKIEKVGGDDGKP